MGLTVRQKAALAWERERPMREAARLEKRAKMISAAREKLTRIFGAEHEIKVGVEVDGKVIALVEDLRFTTISYYAEIITVSLVEKCPICGLDLPLGPVSNLADVGELLAQFEAGMLHDCDPTLASS
ncbi:MAG: hypothetical protein M3362_01440 [Acidobacteriota bacterium]|nr:hypothetical protein [Acidobacteriota bacterium]